MYLFIRLDITVMADWALKINKLSIPIARCEHKSKDTTPSIAWRREAWKEEVPDDLP